MKPEYLPDFPVLLSELIAQPSVSSSSEKWNMSNAGVINKLAQWLESLGFVVELMTVSKAPEKLNLVATLGTGAGGLVLSGHTDTVPYDDSRWSSDPFTVTEKGGRWYGLGTCDMKGFFAVVIQAVREMGLSQLKQPLIVLATADEETSMAGAKALAAAGKPKARYAVIGEPTGLRPVHMHKGVMMERIRLQGLSGHSSNPALGHSALECMADMINALRVFRSELQLHKNMAFQVATPTLNLGHICGGDNPNRICGACELQFDLRPLPGMSLEALRGDILQRLQPIAEANQVSMRFERLFDGVPPFANEHTHGLVNVCERLTGHAPQAVAFATEAPYLQALGMDTLVMGPGSIDQAHQPDEYVDQSQVVEGIRVIKALISHYCL
ncbi:MAG: acetylornithine deacetylase [Hahellaceae bacterium]|nr:acetylornithine deacetylase [Hahellaceae bacterium]MCP5170469.1 acetylornithine deacetylase [Hahellaceae bacterium]